MTLIRISKAVLHLICPSAQILIVDMLKEAFSKAFQCHLLIAVMQ